MRKSERKLEGIINIRLELSGDDARKFLKLKEKRGLKNNSELVRQLLKEAQTEELKKGA